MKSVSSFVFGAVLSGALVALVWLHVPLAQVGALLAGAVCLAWLSVVVVLPWNLLFGARRTLRELARAKERGVTVTAAQEARARRIERLMVRVSVGLHLASAALLALGSWWAGVPLGRVFAALFLLSTLFRPAVEYYRSLRGQLAELVDEARYPHADVLRLVAEVEAQRVLLDAGVKANETLAARFDESEGRVDARLSEVNRRLELVARRFDEALERVTDHRELISGLRAFLKLVRTG